jgi:anti-anti-sigma regulatory factor
MSVSGEHRILPTGHPYQFTADGPGRWQLSGEVDVAVSDQFAAALAAALGAAGTDGAGAAGPDGCAISLDELRFIDLSGLRALAAAATAAGVRMELHGVPAVFWRYWYLAGFSEAVTGVYPVS